MKTVEIVYRYSPDGPALTRPADAESARRRLDEGNRGFSSLLHGSADGTGTARRVVPLEPRDLGLAHGEMGRPPQRPFAAVLGCSDARVPIELIFNEGPNDLFVVRVAGNGLGDDTIGSLRYALDNLGASLKLVVVLGHSGCGALSAAVDLFLQPSGYLRLSTRPHLRGILDRLMIVVEASSRQLRTTFGGNVAERPGYRDALIEMAVAVNAALTAHTMQTELRDGDPAGMRAAYGVYLIETQEVWAPHEGSGWTGLADPPADTAAFLAFGGVIARSPRIMALLDAPPAEDGHA